MDSSIVANRGFSQKINNRMANSVDLDKMARYAVSSGSALFAKVFVLVSRDDRANVSSTVTLDAKTCNR